MKNKLPLIMLIDDDDEDNYFHKIVIDEMDIAQNVVFTLSGFEALDFLKKTNEQQPDLIFLDIKMPKMNGWEFLKEYSNLNENQKAKVIVVMLSTPKNSDDEKNAAAFNETIDFDYKPLTEKSITRILEDYFY